jgi:hypothetical protein
MMSRISDLVKESLNGGDEIQCVLPVQHEKTSGYIVLSKEKMLFVDEDLLTHEDHFSHRVGRPPFEIPLWAILSIEVDLDHKNASNGTVPLAVIANDGDIYIFRSLFSTQVKTAFENLKKEELQVTAMH